MHLYIHFLSLGFLEFLGGVWRNSMEVCGKGVGIDLSLHFLFLYLFATLSDGGCELTHYHIHTLQTWLLQLLHLLFHYGFKSEVRREETRSAWQGQGGRKQRGRRKQSRERAGRRRKEKEGKGKREKTQGKMRSDILVHSVSLLNQVSIAMGPVHCQVSGESTGKWKWQRGMR